MNTNYKQVEKDTPKAFKKLKKWLDCEDKDILQFELMMILKNERDLFDFFDDMGICIGVFKSPNPSDHYYTYWDWEIYVDGQCMDSSEVEEPNRKEAETEAFKRAFKILEKQQFICPECKEQKDKWIDKCEDCTLKEFK